MSFKETVDFLREDKRGLFDLLREGRGLDAGREGHFTVMWLCSLSSRTWTWQRGQGFIGAAAFIPRFPFVPCSRAKCLVNPSVVPLNSHTGHLTVLAQDDNAADNTSAS